MMLRNAVYLLSALLLLAGCSRDEPSIEMLESRLEIVEERLDALESAGAPGLEAGRLPGEPTALDDPVLEAVEDRLDGVVAEGTDAGIEDVIAAAFAEVPEFGTDDPEFGGVVLRRDGTTIELILTKNGLLHVDTLRLAMAALRFETEAIDRLLLASGEEVVFAESTDGNVSASSVATEDELALVLSPIGVS